MSQTEQTKSFIRDYFDALNENAFERVPIADNCRYTGSMLAETIEGAEPVREHIRAIAPFIDHFEVRHLLAEGRSGAVIVRLSGLGRKTIEGAVFFEVVDGQLSRLDNLFDTRQLLHG